MKTLFEFQNRAGSTVLKLSVLLTSLVATTALATPAQLASIIAGVKASRACENVTLGTTCFGNESCEELSRQKKEALNGFEDAGLRIETSANPWLMVLRPVGNELRLQPVYGESGLKVRAVVSNVTYYHRTDLACANAIALAVSIVAREGAHGYRNPLVPVYLGSRSARPKYVDLTWSNPDLLIPRLR